MPCASSPVPSWSSSSSSSSLLARARVRCPRRGRRSRLGARASRGILRVLGRRDDTEARGSCDMTHEGIATGRHRPRAYRARDPRDAGRRGNRRRHPVHAGDDPSRRQALPRVEADREDLLVHGRELVAAAARTRSSSRTCAATVRPTAAARRNAGSTGRRPGSSGSRRDAPSGAATRRRSSELRAFVSDADADDEDLRRGPGGGLPVPDHRVARRVHAAPSARVGAVHRRGPKRQRRHRAVPPRVRADEHVAGRPPSRALSRPAQPCRARPRGRREARTRGRRASSRFARWRRSGRRSTRTSSIEGSDTRRR